MFHHYCSTVLFSVVLLLSCCLSHSLTPGRPLSPATALQKAALVKKTWDEQLSREGSSASEADVSADEDFEERRRATSFFGLPQINSPVWVQALAEEQTEEDSSDDATAADAVPVDEAELDLSVQQSVSSSGESSSCAESCSGAAAVANGAPGGAAAAAADADSTVQPNALELSVALDTLCKSVRDVLSNGVQAAAHEQRAAQALADLADCTRTLQSRLSSSSSSAATAPGTSNAPFVQLPNGSTGHTVSSLLCY
jgi:hypothetical protein